MEARLAFSGGENFLQVAYSPWKALKNRERLPCLRFMFSLRQG
jgi:hypothetical protein